MAWYADSRQSKFGTCCRCWLSWLQKTGILAPSRYESFMEDQLKSTAGVNSALMPAHSILMSTMAHLLATINVLLIVFVGNVALAERR